MRARIEGTVLQSTTGCFGCRDCPNALGRHKAPSRMIQMISRTFSLFMAVSVELRRAGRIAHNSAWWIYRSHVGSFLRVSVRSRCLCGEVPRAFFTTDDTEDPERHGERLQLETLPAHLPRQPSSRMIYLYFCDLRKVFSEPGRLSSKGT